MCGINGLVTTRFRPDEIRKRLTRMNDKIVHRGPDDDGIYVSPPRANTVGMGMRRLSIIDLENGGQPMCSDDGSIVLVFNGEIYNYRSLRAELQREGISFQTQSDTEVVLRLYERDGAASFTQLDGMFAFSIYDENNNEVLLVRDYFGEKPLYYSKADGNFWWGSELKSLVGELDGKPPICHQGMNLFFRLTYIPAPFTIYETVRKLEPNTCLRLNLETFESVCTDVHSRKLPPRLDISFEQAKTRVRQLVQDSVQSRSVSDVPIGTFLSGGVDSSIVSFCLAEQTKGKIDTFSIGFDKRSFDETEKARTVARRIGSRHHEFMVTESQLRNDVDRILLNFDEPFADSSALPTYFVSNKTREHVKVALTGDGGDEVFGGYNKYHIGRLNKGYTRVVPRGIHQGLLKLQGRLLKREDDSRGIRYKVERLLQSVSYEDDFYWDVISLGFTEESLRKLLRKDCLVNRVFQYFQERSTSHPRTIHEFRQVDHLMSLEGDMLTKVDRTSMLNSLECRSPFLNRELFEFTLSVPEHFLTRRWNKKYLLKQAFADVFPKGFLNKKKQGFGVPVGDWVRTALREDMERLSAADYLKRQGIFNANFVQELVGGHLDGGMDRTFPVWSFFCFQKWYSQYYDAS